MTHATFAALVGAQFQIKIDGLAVPCELVEATALPPGGPARPATLARREAFSLVFRAPPGTSAPQQTFEVHHPGIGTQHIFLVPIGPDDVGPRYEAVFN